ncbi:ABC transporter permease [Paraburkholderia xenovorans]|uniref:ABC transporter permease n=1 Tax=Paraburkholderia xenovorans TaxID=36873 RepID=UPI001559C12C|nr:ABC transporter permease [Paraburkholderia xenovorans]NPT39137.1 ABC transporter permease subunit [Paraburkholderia xenovorans]
MFLAALKRPLGYCSAAALIFILLLAVFGPWLSPYDPVGQTSTVLAAPSAMHWLGTDYLGRDVLSRILSGARLSVFAALEVVIIGFVVGVIPALLSAYSGRAFEWFSLRIMDTLVTIPFLVFAVAVTQLVGNGLQQAMIVVGIMISPAFFRVTRSAALAVGNTHYVQAAILAGASPWWIVRRHVLNKIVASIAIASANVLAGGFVVVSSLTYLGIGIVPPNPTWGGILSSDLAYLGFQPYAPLFPGALIVVTIAALNGFADALRDVSAQERSARRPQTATGLVAQDAAGDAQDPGHREVLTDANGWRRAS